MNASTQQPVTDATESCTVLGTVPQKQLKQQQLLSPITSPQSQGGPQTLYRIDGQWMRSPQKLSVGDKTRRGEVTAVSIDNTKNSVGREMVPGRNNKAPIPNLDENFRIISK